MADERLIEFLCECGAYDRDAKVEMTLAERDEVDHGEHRWVIAPGHKLHPGDRVVEKTARFWLVASDD